MRRINKDNMYGIRAEFALRRKQRETIEDVAEGIVASRHLAKVDGFDSELDMSQRNIKGPFSEPPSFDGLANESVISHADYESALAVADPLREFFVGFLDERDETFADQKARIVRGRCVTL